MSKNDLRVEGEQVILDVFKAMNSSFELHSYLRINDLVVAETYKDQFAKLPLEVCYTQLSNLVSKKEEISECLKYLEASPSCHLIMIFKRFSNC